MIEASAHTSYNQTCVSAAWQKLLSLFAFLTKDFLVYMGIIFTYLVFKTTKVDTSSEKIFYMYRKA